MEHNGGRPRAFTTTGSSIGGMTTGEEDPMALQMDGSAQLSILNSLLSSTNKAKFLVRSPPSRKTFALLSHSFFLRFRSFLEYLHPSPLRPLSLLLFVLFCFLCLIIMKWHHVYRARCPRRWWPSPATRTR